jgi:hypothetical protein
VVGGSGVDWSGWDGGAKALGKMAGLVRAGGSGLDAGAGPLGGARIDGEPLARAIGDGSRPLQTVRLMVMPRS